MMAVGSSAQLSATGTASDFRRNEVSGSREHKAKSHHQKKKNLRRKAVCNHSLLLDSAGNNNKPCESEYKGEGYPIKKTEGVRKSKYKKTKIPDSLCHDWDA